MRERGRPGPSSQNFLGKSPRNLKKKEGEKSTKRERLVDMGKLPTPVNRFNDTDLYQ